MFDIKAFLSFISLNGCHQCCHSDIASTRACGIHKHAYIHKHANAHTGARAKAWCLLIHAEAPLCLSRTHTHTYALARSPDDVDRRLRCRSRRRHRRGHPLPGALVHARTLAQKHSLARSRDDVDLPMLCASVNQHIPLHVPSAVQDRCAAPVVRQHPPIRPADIARHIIDTRC